MEAWMAHVTRRNEAEEWRDESYERKNKIHRCATEITPAGHALHPGNAASVPNSVESPLVRIQKALFCSPLKRSPNHERKMCVKEPQEENDQEEAKSGGIAVRVRSLPEPMPRDSAKCKEHVSQLVEQALERTKRRPLRTPPVFKEHLLPTVDDCHYGPSRITAETLADVIMQPERWEVCEYLIVDCRYPYEFNGGHVKGAINLFEPADVEHAFLSEDKKINQNTVIIFHCEFSSQRAPKMYGHIRNLDRKMNLKNYPKLDFPYMYIMDGGYKDFFSKFEELCEGGYTMMCDPDHEEELKTCHTRYKSLWQDRGLSHRGSY